MYDINDRKSAVKEIKKYLYFVAEYAYPEMPRTTIDSNFDKETTESVKAFQTAVGLKPTGKVDLETFNMLYSVYKKTKDDKESRDYIITDGTFPLMPGDINEDVRILNILINELGQVFTELDNVGNSNYYSKKTENAIKIIREIFMMQDVGYVDKLLYLRMLAELDAHKRNKRTNDLKN